MKDGHNEDVIRNIEVRISEIESAAASLKNIITALYEHNRALVKKLRDCEDAK